MNMYDLRYGMVIVNHPLKTGSPSFGSNHEFLPVI